MTVLAVVQRERRRLLRLRLAALAGLAIALAVLLVAAGALLLDDARWLALPRAVPFLIWGAILGAEAMVLRAALRVARRSSVASVAAAIETEQRLRAGALRGVIEIAGDGPLARRAAGAVATTLGSRGPVLAPALRRAASRRAGAGLGAAVLAAGALAALVPVLGDGLLALLRPANAYAGTLLPALAFRAAPTDVLRGEPVRLMVVAPGRTTVEVRFRATGEGWQTVRLPVRDGLAVAALGDMRGTLHAVATDGRARTDTAMIALAERPFLGGVTIRAVYPAYLGRAPESLPADARLDVPRGTMLTLAGRASMTLAAVALVSGSDTVALPSAGQAFGGRLIATRTGVWTWLARAARGGTVDLPDALRLDVRPDSVPVVEIITPAVDTTMAPGGTLALRMGAADDHGVAAVLLETAIERGGRVLPVRRHTVAPRVGRAWEGATSVALDAEGAQPGDALTVRALAVDGSPWAQTGASRTLRVRVSTSEERRDAARTLGDSAVAAAVAAARAQKALAQRTADAARARGERTPTPPASAPGDAAGAAQNQAGKDAASPMSFQAGERARTIAQEQRQLVERINALRDAATQLERGLKQAGALDSSIARQLREAQDLMRQALSPELTAQMQRLEQAANQLDGEQARAAMQDLAKLQQQMREQLEQSAEMLKRAAHEGAMQTLRDEAKEIAQQQRALGDSAVAGKARGAEEARRLADRSDRFADDVKALQERLARDRATAAGESTDAARDAAQRAEERLRDAAAQADRQDGSAAPRPAPRGEPEQAMRPGMPPRPPSTPEQTGGTNAPRERGARGESQPERSSPPSTPSGAAPQPQLASAANAAAQQMDRAADAMQQARDAQVKEWKQELTAELDRAVQETLQMAREESAMAQQLRQGGAKAGEMRGRQGSVQQGVDQTGKRLDDAGKRSSLLSGGARRAMDEARQKVEQATKELGQSQGGDAAKADALDQAAEALNRAASSLARDRQRANEASSASGFAEMMQQMQQMAQRQGSINAQAQNLMQMPGGAQSTQGMQAARALARQQRQVAQQLDDLGDEVGGGRAGDLAREAKQLAEALEAGRLDAATSARQQQLFKRLLDAGRALEKEEREDTDRREARAATDAARHAPQGATTTGREARRYREPRWEDLRGLSAEERRAILEYFKRINEPTP